jgi:Family of unknown function (DUF6090)
MINFFRKIRKQLADDNKPVKYFRYAIGEIVLVVIGILIALSINNWNQERLERKSEHKILIDLRVEFEANLYDLNRVITQHKIVFNESRELQRITVAEAYDSAILDSLMLSTSKWFSFTQRPGASENLISSGNLNIISNKGLRDLINQWSGIVDDVIDDETFLTDFTNNTFLPFLAKHYPASNLEYPHVSFINAYIQNISIDFTPIIKQKDVDWQQLLNNREFQSLISLKKTYEINTISELEIALDACNKIINQINSELEK